MCTGAEVALLVAAGASTAITVHNQKEQADFQADQAKANAETERQAGEIKAQKARERARRVAASARAAIAASGLDVNSVSANLINKDIIERGEEDAFVQTLNAEDRASALRQQANVFKLEGKQAVSSGVARFGSSAVSAGARSDGTWYGYGGSNA